MCMEDIRIGRKTTPKSYGITTVAVGEEVVPYNPHRVSLQVFVFSANGVPISMSPDTTNNFGAFVSVGSGGLRLNIQQDGALVFGPWYCGGPIGSMVGYIEATLADK